MAIEPSKMAKTTLDYYQDLLEGLDELTNADLVIEDIPDDEMVPLFYNVKSEKLTLSNRFGDTFFLLYCEGRKLAEEETRLDYIKEGIQETALDWIGNASTPNEHFWNDYTMINGYVLPQDVAHDLGLRVMAKAINELMSCAKYATMRREAIEHAATLLGHDLNELRAKWLNNELAHIRELVEDNRVLAVDRLFAAAKHLGGEGLIAEVALAGLIAMVEDESTDLFSVHTALLKLGCDLIPYIESASDKSKVQKLCTQLAKLLSVRVTEEGVQYPLLHWGLGSIRSARLAKWFDAADVRVYLRLVNKPQSKYTYMDPNQSELTKLFEQPFDGELLLPTDCKRMMTSTGLEPRPNMSFCCLRNRELDENFHYLVMVD